MFEDDLTENTDDRKPLHQSLHARCPFGPLSRCGRSVEEIARWSAMGDAERARVMAELPTRFAGRAQAISAG
jgi:hypothetical protein